MIISPTTENFSILQPASDYTVILPDPKISLEPPKSISSMRTISGGSVISVWSNSVVGVQRIFKITVDKQKYSVLKKIKDSGVDSWLWRIFGKTYQIVFDLTSAVMVDRLAEKWLCEISIVISKDENK